MGDTPEPAKQVQEVKQSAEPWSGVRAPLQRLYPKVEDLAYTEIPYYTEDTLAPIAPETSAAWDLTANRALFGSPTVDLANLEAQKTLAGDYLVEGNPYTSMLGDRLARETQGRVGSAYAASGHRFGGLGEQEMFARTFADAMAPQLFGEYGAERDRMGRQGVLAPSLARERYQDLAMLGGVGRDRQARGQAEIADEMTRYYYPYQQPYDQLSWLSGILHGGGQLGGVTSGTTTGYTQPAGISPLSYIGAGSQAAGQLLPFFFI